MPGASLPESKTDVLIIGAGPAGLMSAAWMAHLGVKARIIDKRNTKIFAGQADGLQCRSLEIFDSLGFADRVWKEANHMLEVRMVSKPEWNPDKDGKIRRSEIIPDTPPGISRFTEVVVHQGRIERFFLDNIRKYSDIEVERGVMPESLVIDESEVEDLNAYPITVQLRHLTEEEATPAQQSVDGSTTETVQDGLFRSNLADDDTDELLRRSREKDGSSEIVYAKYLIGCDGAHSWTRRQVGAELEGEPTDFIWGVLDIVPITDFPDIRCRCMIHSESNGSLMNIPRENNLTRLYIQLTEVKPDASGRADRSKITPEIIIKAAQRIIAPYKLEYTYCDWWTAYQIGQRVGKTFSKHNRVFLAGDAVHTHSPKAGQGMNVGMQDAYNLGWKVGLCARNVTPRTILPTYQSERRRVAQDLIDFDHKFSRLFSGRPAKDIMDESGVSMEEFKKTFLMGALFTAGLSLNYGKSIIVAKEGDAQEQGDGSAINGAGKADEGVVGKQHLATNIKLGMRFPSFKIMNQMDSRPWHFQELIKADGRFRILLFAGDYRNPQQRDRVKAFCDAFQKPNSFLRRVTGSRPIDAVIEILTCHSAPRKEVEFFDFPELLRPFVENVGWDYSKIFADDESYHEGHGHAYENYGVDPERGCVVVLRPDQYVGYVGEIEDIADLDSFFKGVLNDASVQIAPNPKSIRKQLSPGFLARFQKELVV